MWSKKLSTWLRQLNEMAYEVEDLVDKDEFMIIRDKIKGKRKFSEFNFYQRKFGELLSFFTQKEHLHMYFYLKAVKSFMFPQSSMDQLNSINERLGLFLSTANYSMNLLDAVTEFQREIMNPNSLSIAKFVGRAKEKKVLGELEKQLLHRIYTMKWRDLNLEEGHISRTNSGEKDLPVNDFNILSQTLCGKRFFLVLDDVRNNIENQWNNLFAALESGAPGSKVLITTQSHKIARRIGTVKPIHLDVLEPEAMLTLFKHHALGGAEIDEEKERVLRSMSSNIVTNLCGLPLAAKIIGNMLRSNLNEREWRRVSELQWWNFKEAIDGILPSLLVGYQQLEAGQRKCFAYCCIFPKNHIFLKERLVQMWIANDFIPQNDQEMVTMEDIGRRWFDDLVEKSFIQPSGENTEFTMNDLMQGLAAVVSTDQNLSLTQESSIPSTVRHLALPASKIEVLCDIARSSTLRTIILSGTIEINKINMLNTVFSKLTCLRVLQLSGISMQELPYAIRYLLHLRYLDLSYTGIKYLHQSICRCYHLQVLDLEGCNFKSLPDGMNDLINLRHLYADSRTISLIAGIGQLTNLQELNEFHIGMERGYKITELKNMRFLSGELHIMGIENVSCTEEEETQNHEREKKEKEETLAASSQQHLRPLLQSLRQHLRQHLRPPPAAPSVSRLPPGRWVTLQREGETAGTAPSFLSAGHPLPPPLPSSILLFSPPPASTSASSLKEERVDDNSPSRYLSRLDAPFLPPPLPSGEPERIGDNSPSRQPFRLMTPPPFHPQP
ncbi:putative disease resistance protein RGA3 [Carex littledalei]|uniref:Putative disease resistance protein RGA3 n=1 Tax=Carex littledalei TaxID=544730 RepID=A0A833RG83_9POAL|nr:putative disease resistance protein RGA3 [Carex littledalei]